MSFPSEYIAPGPDRAAERPVFLRFRKWRSAAHARLAGIALALVAALLAVAQPARAAAPEFSEQGDLTSDTGYVLLNWHSRKPVSLMIATVPDFSDAVIVYDGSAHSFFLSGLGNGEYYLRIKGSSGATSAPVTLTVEHQSLRRAFLLLVIGAIITLAIVLTILRGARDE